MSNDFRKLDQKNGTMGSGRIKIISTCVCLMLVLGTVGLVHLLFPIEPLLEEVRFSKVYYDRKGQLLAARLSPDEKWRFQSHLEDVSPMLVEALLTFEDQRFYQHAGVDFQAVLRAFWQNVNAGHIVSGASTISMQVARLLSQERQYGSWWGKVAQVFRAFQLEQHLSKDQILEWYFNLAPYGGNIEGVVAASWFYFSKPPSQLSWTESIALAITPKSPNIYRPDRFPLIVQKHCQHLVERLSAADELSQEDLWFIECSKVPGKLVELPRHAKHLIDRLHTGSGKQSSLVLQGHSELSHDWNHILTTLDLDLQISVEATVSGYLQGLRSQSIHNAAAIVIDNQTSEVLAYVGSPDFTDKQHAGEVDGVRALRSPGSTLKPFIYARALESGQYNSHTLLANVPVVYPGYRPQNFKPEELGITHFDNALRQSLNLPAVALNTVLGKKNDLLSTLWQAGVSTLPHSRDHYGQSLVLGGGELRLDELSVLYSALARGGKLRPVKLVLSEQKNAELSAIVEEKNWFTPEASFIISQILKEVSHPQYGLASPYFRGVPHVAWKTGTSSRQRDAWTIGYNPQYTVGVWVGNFNGSPVEGMTGLQVSAPLFFEIFRSLSRHQSVSWPPAPPDVVQQSVCSLSGNLANAFCPGEISTWWIAGVTEPNFCQMHLELITDRLTGKRLSPKCVWERDIPQNQIRRTPAVLWPQATGGWLAKSQSAVIFPPYAEGCVPSETLEQSPPILQRPVHGENYVVQLSGKAAAPFARFDQIAFSASVNNEVNRLDWYLNGQKIVSTQPGEIYLWSPTPGSHELVLVDDFGRATQAQFTVWIE